MVGFSEGEKGFVRAAERGSAAHHGNRSRFRARLPGFRQANGQCPAVARADGHRIRLPDATQIILPAGAAVARPAYTLPCCVIFGHFHALLLPCSVAADSPEIPEAGQFRWIALTKNRTIVLKFGSGFKFLL